MLKKWFHSFLESMGLLAILFTVLSLIFRDVMKMEFFHLAVCVLAPIQFFSFFTYKLKLFSHQLWTRRMIVMVFSVCVILAMNMLFGYLRFAANSMILYGIAIVLFVLASLCSYCIADKIEQRNLKLINQKLAKKNEIES